MTINLERPPGGIRPGGLGFLEVTDMFCGAGGSSLGLEYVPGVVVTQCINHDRLAIEAHNSNFPHADHDYQDIWETPAARFRRTPILWASPSCTHHAFCRGERSETEEADKSRATMWCVVRFTDHHRYDAVIVENVVEARLWCDYRSHGPKCNCGRTFDDWCRRMHDLGYESRIVYFNSQFALPTPQSRDRMYVVFWKKGAPEPNLDFRPTSWCSSCERVVRGVQDWKKASPKGVRSRIFEWGRYGTQYVYSCPECRGRVAPAVVGARSIIDFDNVGVQIGARDRSGLKPLKPKTRLRIKIGLENLRTMQPIQVKVGGHLYERKGYARVWSIDTPLRTLHCTNDTALVVPNKSGSVPQSIEQPAASVTGRQHLGVVVRAGGQAPVGRVVDQPFPTITAHDRQMAIVLQNMENNVARDVAEPAPPVTTGGNHVLVQVNRGGGKKASDSTRNWSVHEPVPTITAANRGEVAIIGLRNQGSRNESVRCSGEPAQTVVGSGNHHGMLVYNGVPGFVRDLGDAAGTVTARDKQSLLVPYYATGVAKTIEQPCDALTGKDRHALVVTEDDIDECFFRMLKWPELLKAQQMHQKVDGTPYVLEARRQDRRGRWVGLSDELRVRYIGNAVSSPVAAMLGHAVAEALR